MTGPQMSGPQHYREAERLLVVVERTPDQWGDAAEYCRQQLATAHVHATLALAAATAYPAPRDYYCGHTPTEWAGVAS